MATAFSPRFSPPPTSRSPSILAASTSPSRSPLRLPNRYVKFNLKCNYSGQTVVQDTVPTTIDVEADAKSERVVVLGGNGFVGSSICKAAFAKGMKVTSVSRSGRPTPSASWMDQVDWISGDVFHLNWDEVLLGATAVVSSLGGFGCQEHMTCNNGKANVVAVNAAKDHGIGKFVLMSVHDYNLPSYWLQCGFFTGIKKAESEVLSKYPNSGVVLRPAVIYGKRRIAGVEIPFDLIGEPVERLLGGIEEYTKPLSFIPGSDLILAPPISVHDVAYAAVDAVIDEDVFGILGMQQMKDLAAKLKGSGDMDLIYWTS